MPFPVITQDDIKSEEVSPIDPTQDILADQTATSGNPPEINTSDLAVDANKVSDIMPIHQLTGIPAGDLYDSHKEVMSQVQAHNDEGLLRSFQASMKVADYNLRKSWLGWRLLNGDTDPNIEQEVRKLDEQMRDESQYIVDKGLFSKAVNSVGGLLPFGWNMMQKGLKGGLATGMLMGGGAAATGALPLVPEAAAAGFIAGSAAFDAQYMSQIESGGMYMELYNLKDDKGNRINPNIVKTFSLAVGAINGALGAANVNVLLKTVPGLDKVMSDIVKNSVLKLVKDGTIRKYLLSAAGRYAKYLGETTALVTAQEGVRLIGEEVAKTASNEFENTNLPHQTIQEATNRLIDTAEKGILGFAVLGIPSHVIQIMPGLIDKRSETNNRTLRDILPPDKELSFDKEIKNTYERIKNTFFGERDLRILKNKQEGIKLKEDLAKLTKEGQTPQELGIAMQLYRDSKNHPEAVEAALKGLKYVEKEERPPISRGFEGVKPPEQEMKEVRSPLTETQIKLIEMSKNLTKEQKAFIDEYIDKPYKDMAEEALGADVIYNTQNNFVGRSWLLKTKKARDAISRLTGTTIHAKERRLPTIVEGWTDGLKMLSHDVVDNLTMYRDTMIKTIEQKRFINANLAGKTYKGNPIFTYEKLPGYEKINMPNYSVAGKRTLFAPRKIARNVNNIFGVSKLYDAPGVEMITKINALEKTIALSTSFFHNIAFLRSFYLGAKSRFWDSMNPFTAHREGIEMIRNMDDAVQLGVYNGLTLNIIQDWEDNLLRMRSDLDSLTSKYTGKQKVKEAVYGLWRKQVDFTFGVQGAGLKAKAFTYLFAEEMAKNPEQNKNRVAERVASLINDDFGGLHLQRLGRNPTLQHIFSLVALAPDWTESNIRTVVNMFNLAKPKEFRQVYRKFWARVVLKTAVATAMMNLLLAGADPNEAYDRWKKGIEQDWKNVASVDITPLYSLFGMNPEQRKYFSIAGHFLDPAKYIHDPTKAVQYKMSMMSRMIHDWVFQENWQGKRYKNLAEIPVGVKDFADYMNPDTYVTYRPVPKRGKFFEQHFSFPAFFIHDAIGTSPIAFQNLLASLSGEISAMDAIMNTVGARQRKPKKIKRR